MSAEAARLAWALGRARALTLSLVSDVPSGEGCRQSAPGEHHPEWIVGHLLLGDVYLLHLLGGAALSGDFPALIARYGPESAPASAEAVDMGLAALIGRLRATGLERDQAVAALPASGLGKPMPDPVLARAQPTIAHHLHALVNHEGYHAGELTAWRRAHARPVVRWAPGAASDSSVRE